MRNLLAGSAAIFCATVAAATAQQASAPRKTAARDPVFTTAQAERGARAYDANCAGCHLPGLDGSANPMANAKGAPLVGPRFVQDFGEAKVSDLFNKMKRDMPNGKPGSLTDQQYLDLAAFVLLRNKFPAGQAELTVESATDVWIPGAGGAEGLVDYTYVSGVGRLQRDPTGSWLLTAAQELKRADAAAAGPAEASGQYTFRLLDAYDYAPEPHDGQEVRVCGYLVRLGAEIRVNVQAFQTVSASCGNAGPPAPANSRASITAEPPAAASPQPQNPLQARTVWSGVYSEAQAYSGEKVADTACLGCHGAGLGGGDSGPRLVGGNFLAEWNARSTGELFDWISEKMPGDAPGTLKKEDVASVMAYIFKVNAMPAGKQDLPAERDTLARIPILATRP